MALDTANKRSSAIHGSLPWRGRLPFPDGTIDSTDRLHAGGVYAGIAATSAGKRASAIHVAIPWRGLLPIPDGSISQRDRAVVAYMYDGIDAASPFASGAMVVQIDATAGPVLLSSATLAVAAALSASNIKAASGTMSMALTLAANGQLNEDEQGTINVDISVAARGTTLAGQSVTQIPAAISLSADGRNVTPATMSVTATMSAHGASVIAATANVELNLSGIGQSEALTFGRIDAVILMAASASSLAAASASTEMSLSAMAQLTTHAAMSVAAAMSASAQINEEVFPRAEATVSVGMQAMATSVSVPGERVAVPAARTIDWKTLTDQANKGLPTVPDYEFGYGRRRRVFRQRKS